MNTALQILIVLFLGFAATAVTSQLHRWDDPALSCQEDLLEPGEVCFHQINLSSEILWIDARNHALWEKNGVKGSIFFGAEALKDPSLIEALAPRLLAATTVLVYCGGGECETSHQVVTYLTSLGLNQNMKVLYGGHPSLPSSLLR